MRRDYVGKGLIGAYFRMSMSDEGLNMNTVFVFSILSITLKLTLHLLWKHVINETTSLPCLFFVIKFHSSPLHTCLRAVEVNWLPVELFNVPKRPKFQTPVSKQNNTRK